MKPKITKCYIDEFNDWVCETSVKGLIGVGDTEQEAR